MTTAAALDGVDLERERALRIAEGSPRLRNRAERRLAGYREAYDWALGPEPLESLGVPLVMRLHRLVSDPAKGGDLRSDSRLEQLLLRYQAAKREQAAHPLALLGGLVVDFLAIHPPARGGGAVARLLTLRELLSEGYEVARYVSVEQRVRATADRYAAALRESQLRWWDGGHTVWPWTAYLAGVLASAGEELEERVATARAPTGSKRARVREHVLGHGPARFRRRDVERALPGVSNGTVRLVLAELRAEGKIEVDGGGRGAGWRRTAAG